MDLLAFVLALQAEGKTAEEVRAAVNQYLEDNPGAINQAAVEAILDDRLDDIEDDVGGLKSAIDSLEIEINGGESPIDTEIAIADFSQDNFRIMSKGYWGNAK